MCIYSRMSSSYALDIENIYLGIILYVCVKAKAVRTAGKSWQPYR